MWNQIKAEYIAGGTSYRKLASKYEVSFSRLRRIAAKEHWTELRAQTAAETDMKMVADISDKNADHAGKIMAVADKLLDKISESIAKTADIPSKSLKNYTSALKDLKEIKGIKSDADMREQEARIKKLLKEAEEEKHTTDGIDVVFSAGEDSWNE